MKTWQLIRKEIRENRWALVVGLVLFVAIPLGVISIDWRMNHRLGGSLGESILGYFGWLLIIFVPIGATCRDMRGSLPEFWQSRPISLFRYLLVKYLVGLGVLSFLFGFSCWTQSLLAKTLKNLGPVEPYTHIRLFEPESLTTFFVLSMSYLLVYSVAFLMGFLMRREVSASFLAAAALLVVLFLPMVVPALDSVSPFNLEDECRVSLSDLPGCFGFSASVDSSPAAFKYPISPFYFYARLMMLLSVGVFLLAWYSVKRGWQVSMNLKMLCWTLGMVILILCFATASEMGTSLRLVKRIDIEDEPVRVLEVSFDKDIGVIVAGPLFHSDESYKFLISPMDLNQEQPWISPPLTLVSTEKPTYLEQLGCLGDLPGHFWFVKDRRKDRKSNLGPRESLELVFAKTVDESTPQIVSSLDLLAIYPDLDDYYRSPLVTEIDGRLFVGGEEHLSHTARPIYEINLSDLSNPKATQLPFLPNTCHSRCLELLSPAYVDPTTPSLELPLLPVPGLTPKQRFELYWRLYLQNELWRRIRPCRVFFDDSRLVQLDRSGKMTIYRLLDADDEFIRFERIGSRRGTPLESFSAALLDAKISGNYVYAFKYGFSLPVCTLTVFDISNPEKPVKAGHYSAPEEYFNCFTILKSGNVLLGGKNLHIVAPPGH